MDIFSAAPGVGRPSRSFTPVAAIGAADDDGGGCGGYEAMLDQEGDDTDSEKGGTVESVVRGFEWTSSVCLSQI